MSYVELRSDRDRFTGPDTRNTAAVFHFDGMQDTVELNFMKTKRLRGSGVHGLPPSLGEFSLDYIENHKHKFTPKELSRGGAFLEMPEDSAMWINFGVSSKNYGNFIPLYRPFAIKVASGKINAASGLPWVNELTAAENDYMELPSQHWIDGFKREPGNVVNQFVAKALGQGYTAEEQLTGEAEFGGIQIIVYPLKQAYWDLMVAAHNTRYAVAPPSLMRSFSMHGSGVEMACSASGLSASSESASMGMGLGAQIRQVIHAPTLPLDAWDMNNGVRLFVHLKSIPATVQPARSTLKTIDEITEIAFAKKLWAVLNPGQQVPAQINLQVLREQLFKVLGPDAGTLSDASINARLDAWMRAQAHGQGGGAW